MKAIDGQPKSSPRNRDFSFERSRGIVWVCDLEGSSKYLNDKDCVAELEKFLPRLYFVSAAIVEAAGGKFIKWTGDGFLAWFETPLHREVSEKAAAVFDAIFHLSTFVNVTQLGAKVERTFRLRHGVTYEKDALLTKIKTDGESPALDIIGRDVVLAFRLSGIKAKHPGIATQKELVDAVSSQAGQTITFRRWQANDDELLKFFKGEKRGTSTVYVTADKARKPTSPTTILKKSKKIIDQAEGRIEGGTKENSVVDGFVAAMSAGPEWGKEALKEYVHFIRNDLLGSLKTAVEVIERAKKTDKSPRK